MNKISVSVIGASGKMGTRTSNNLANAPDEIDLFFVENAEAGIKDIEERGYSVTPMEEAVKKSDVVVLAVPDSVIKVASREVVKEMNPGSALVILDPAAAVAKELVMRDDCTFAIAHPCHPSYFHDQDTYKARHDFFGGQGGKQDIIMAKIQGDDEKFAQCRRVSEIMYGPRLKQLCHGNPRYCLFGTDARRDPGCDMSLRYGRNSG